MKKLITILIIFAASLVSAAAADDGGRILTRNVNVQQNGQKIVATLDIVLDSLRLASNRQVFVTPMLRGSTPSDIVRFPTVLVNGRNMQYVYERSGLCAEAQTEYGGSVCQVVRRFNGKQQVIEYTNAVDALPWMDKQDLTFALVLDHCGCGVKDAVAQTDPLSVSFRPHYNFYTAYITPPVTELPVSIHEGRARVQFEVNKTDLHTETYICKNGQRIDNRAQLKVIEDSIAYALSDPNVELASINICGFASPESPYTHNEYLATNRSRALALYIGTRHNLPQERCTYGSVPENWPEFRQQVVAATGITDKQRQDLLELIDRPTYGPADFDAKEKTLKTDPRFAKLYKETILPVWFPELRCTQFAISTRLKPTSDERLAEIIKQTPELLSLNQMFRVARLYPEGSAEFNQTIETALRFYSDDAIANLNAAVAAIKADDFNRAAQLLPKAGNSPEAENARGVVAAHLDDLDAALQHFTAAGTLHEAQLNKAQLEPKTAP